jgi:hypothetical protein
MLWGLLSSIPMVYFHQYLQASRFWQATQTVCTRASPYGAIYVCTACLNGTSATPIFNVMPPTFEEYLPPEEHFEPAPTVVLRTSTGGIHNSNSIVTHIPLLAILTHCEAWAYKQNIEHSFYEIDEQRNEVLSSFPNCRSDYSKPERVGLLVDIIFRENKGTYPRSTSSATKYCQVSLTVEVIIPNQKGWASSSTSSSEKTKELIL